MQEIEQLLRTTMGLDASSIGSTQITRAVRQRMRTLGLRELAAYHEQLGVRHAAHGQEASAIQALAPNEKSAWRPAAATRECGGTAELQELIESVVVTETWFFRDVGAFKALARVATTGIGHPGLRDVRATMLERQKPGRGCRILSLPCSSGEEPYSIAMTLLDAGLRDFHIDAVDISGRALAQAERGVYTRNSFRGRDLSYRDRYFKRLAGGMSHAGLGVEKMPALRTPEAFELDPKVRRPVCFHRGNLLDPVDGLPPVRYDFVFFRNLLIYLDRPAQKRALERVGEHLAAGGMCFVGPAELPLMLDHGYVTASLPMAFACVPPSAKTSAAPHHRSASLRRTKLRIPAMPARASRDGRALDPRPSTLDSKATSAPDSPLGSALDSQPRKQTARIAGDVDLIAAQRLADEGRLGEAAVLCDMHLKAHGPSVPAFYLLGLIAEAQASPKAIEYYRKALYLDPKHENTLRQLALISERDGDKENARNLRRRVTQGRGGATA